MKKILIFGLLGAIITIQSVADILMPGELERFEQEMAKCPESKPLLRLSESGNYECLPCDTVDTLFYGKHYTRYGQQCSEICPNRIVVIEDSVMGGVYCRLAEAPTPDSVFDDIELKWRKKCPDEKPLYVDGECMACDEYKNWDNVRVSGCERCPNKVIIKETSNLVAGMDTEICVLACPDDRPLLSGTKCVSCDDDYYTKWAKAIGCEKCPDREVVDGWCRLKTGM